MLVQLLNQQMEPLSLRPEYQSALMPAPILTRQGGYCQYLSHQERVLTGHCVDIFRIPIKSMSLLDHLPG
ncbi:hypothetical protein D3C80_2016570 [compost metagenome]